MITRTRALAGVVLGLAILAACGGEAVPDAGPVGEVSDEAIAPDWCSRLPRALYAELDRVDVESDWFEVWEAGDGVLALYEPKQWQEVISYLVLGADRALLFDTGMGIARISDVVAQLTELPVIVVNSHSHLDHVGGNAEFSSVVGMDTEFTRERATGLANERVRGEVVPDALCGPLPEGVTQDNYISRSWTVTEVATDGHTIDLGGRVLEILHIPGHTPDAIALLDAAAGYLWTGDTFYEGPIWLFAPETDLDAYEASIARLAGLVPDLTRLLPAHNTPVADPIRLIELRDAFSAVRDGTLEGTRSGPGAETVEYEAGAFSILMAADAGPGD